MDETTGDRPAGEGGGAPDEGTTPLDPDQQRTHGLVFETCYRHPSVATGVHCTRCGRPICPDCMHPAAVGYQCPECLRDARKTAAVPRRRFQVRFFLGRPGSITTTLLITNIVVFLLEVAVSRGAGLFNGPADQDLYRLGAMYPPAIAGVGHIVGSNTVIGHFSPQYWRLITPMFLHANLIHIAFNMYALYLFGYMVEGSFGKARFIAIYFVAGFLASVTSYTFSDPGALGVGASGAIFGLLGAWVAYNYRRRGSPMASAQLRWAGFLIAINLFLGFSIGSIDNYAHIGGLITGAVAGYVAEGFGPRAYRAALSWGGLALLVVIGVIMAIDRTQTIRSMIPV
jgi:membrane associated rhomboid family serine protease